MTGCPGKGMLTLPTQKEVPGYTLNSPSFQTVFLSGVFHTIRNSQAWMDMKKMRTRIYYIHKGKEAGRGGISL